MWRTPITRHWTWWLAASGVAAVLVTVALLIIARLSSTAVTDAEQVLRDVEVAALSPEVSGVGSFSMTTVTPVLDVKPRRVGGAVTPNQNGQEVRSTVWFEAPGRKRVEATVHDRYGEVIWANVIVWDGTDVWFESEAARSGTKSVRVFRQRDLGVNSGGIGPDTGSLNAFLASVTDCYQGKIVGTDIVAGRETYVLNLGRSSCAGTIDKDPLGYGGIADRFIWVDKDTAFILRDELRDSSGSAIPGTSRQVTSVAFNPPIDAGRFGYKPPPGVEVVDCRTAACD